MVAMNALAVLGPLSILIGSYPEVDGELTINPERMDARPAINICLLQVDGHVEAAKKEGIPLMVDGRVVSERTFRAADFVTCMHDLYRLPWEPGIPS